jgi:type I restriction enzyme S subunit
MKGPVQRLGSSVQFIKGKAPRGPLADFQANASDKPYLNPEYLRGASHASYLDNYDNLPQVEDGDVILLWDGSNAGEVLRGRCGVLASTMVKLTPAPDQFHHGYFGHWLKSCEPVLKAMTAGSGIPHVDKGIVRALSWRQIPIDQQSKIASILDCIDAAFSANEHSLSAIRNVKQALLQKLLTGKLKPDGALRQDEEFHIDPKFGRVPVRWSVAKGKALFRIHGSTASKDSRGKALSTTCLFMKVDDFNTPANDPFIVETENAFEPPSPKPVYPCQPGWIVVAKRGAAISHNRVRILAREAVLDPNLMAIEMLGEHSPEYFRYVLLLERLDRYSEVSSIPQLNNKDLYPRLFVMPPPDEQPEILKAIESVEEVVQRRIEKLASLEKLKTALMQNLLTGKIRIPAE